MRKGSVSRKTAETSVTVRVQLEGKGKSKLRTGVKYLNHMLQSLSTHSLMNIEVEAKGDLRHHVTEDVALTLGAAIKEALGERKGIRRFGYAIVPMDEALAQVSLDMARRSFCSVQLSTKGTRIEDMPVEDITHFIQSLTSSMEASVHAKVLQGDNDHHMVEALFKALAVALRQAIEFDPRRANVPSSKGTM